jgi:radical SAM protein with 4Fe4S-binding SPASM domain
MSRLLSKACRHFLNHVVAGYLGSDNGSSLGKLYSLPVKELEEFVRRRMRVSKEEVEGILENPAYRRALFIAAKSVAEYGVTKPQKLISPFLVVWNFTNRCNLKCKHCYQSAGKALDNELSLEEKLDTVHQLASANLPYLALSGGEPLLSEDIFPVAKEASSLGIYTSIATNGTLLTKKIVKRLKVSGISYIQVSVDGAFPELHDSFRGVEGCWKRTIKGIKNAVEEGLTVSIATTITTYNYHHFDEILQLAKKLKVNKLTIYNFIPTGRGRDIVKNDLSPQMRETILKKAQKELSNGFDVLTTAPQFSRVCIEAGGGTVGVAHFGRIGNDKGNNKAEFIADFLGGCGAGRTYCAIQPNGKVTPCVFIPLEAGDLRKEKFISIWRNSPLLNLLRDREDLKGHCGKCRFRASCGGCRARALSYFNDLKAPDAGCIFNLHAWEALNKFEFLGEVESAHMSCM